MAQALSEMLGQLMADPQFAAMVQNLRQNMDLSQSGNTAQENNQPDLSALLEKLPGMVSMLSAMSGTAPGAVGNDAVVQSDAVSALSDDGEDSGTVVSSAAETKKVEAPMQVLFRPEAREKRNKLLSALKPYLSPARCAMIDRAMSAMQLGELLGTMGSTGLGSQTREG